MAVESPLRRWTVGALLTLAAVTGLVDAVSWLRLGHVFVADMAGNVVFLGFSLRPVQGCRRWPWWSLSPVSSAAPFWAGGRAGGSG